jgi:hypothetical protein
LLATDGTWAKTQINLLNAGLRAGVERFTPAEFGIGPLGAQRVDVLQPSQEILAHLRKAKESNPNFEYAGFHVGLFMNYLGYGARDEDAALNGLRDDWIFLFDVKNMKATIPLTEEGDVPSMTMTEIGDVGRFVAATCLLPKGTWTEDFSMTGDTLRLDEIVRIIEQVRGDKMEVSYRSYEQIEKEVREETVFPDKMWVQLELVVACNAVKEGIMPPIVNNLCPSVTPLSIGAYLKKFWV